MKRVYVAHARIETKTVLEWYEEKLKRHGFELVNPFKTRTQLSYEKNPTWVVEHDKKLLKTCDALIIHNPTGRLNIGSMFEAGFMRYKLEKPVAFILPTESLVHVWIKHEAIFSGSHKDIDLMIESIFKFFN